MILSKLAGVALTISVAAGPTLDDGSTVRQMSLRQKTAAVQALIQVATECIARTVAAHPHFRTGPSEELGEIIVASVPSCVAPVRAMIDAHDRYFGDGTGDAFFMGPYLDALPAAVSKRATDSAD